jgi:hypothetical protein
VIGATAKAEQFFTRSANESTKGSRKGFDLLGGGEDPLSVLTTEEQRDSLVARYKGLQKQLEAAKAKGDKALIKSIGFDIANTSREINGCRPKTRSSPEVGQFFIDICREQMPKLQFHQIMDEASRRWREKNGN